MYLQNIIRQILNSFIAIFSANPLTLGRRRPVRRFIKRLTGCFLQCLAVAGRTKAVKNTHEWLQQIINQIQSKKTGGITVTCVVVSNRRSRAVFKNRPKRLFRTEQHHLIVYIVSIGVFPTGRNNSAAKGQQTQSSIGKQQ